MAYNKYQKLVLQGSNDGVNWVDITPFVYKRGDVIEEDSKDCGGGGGVTQYRWAEVDGEYICINNSKYKLLRKELYDAENKIWIAVYPLETKEGDLIEENSSDCEYGTNWVDTERWACKEVETPITYFKVYPMTDGNGTIHISPSLESYSSGTNITISNTPYNNYIFSKYIYGLTENYEYTENNSVFNLNVNNDWYIKVLFSESKPAPAGSLYYSYFNGNESYYNWSKSTLAEYDNNGSIANIIIDYGGVVQTIPFNAFDSHSHLAKIVLPNCSSIGSHAFEYCSSLISIELPNCLFIDSSAFRRCTSLPSIDLPNCSYIGYGAFEQCSLLTSVNLPKCTSIDMNAFSDCGNLAFVNLPLCTYIGSSAFYICSTLQSIDLPNCTSVSNGAFHACRALTSINLPLCTYIGRQAFADCDSLVSIDLPNCKTIDNGAFYNCTTLQSIDLPNCTSVSDGAFGECLSLTSVNLPNCSYVGGGALSYCSALTSVNLPNCSYVGNDVFNDCSNLTSISLPLCTYVGEQAFTDCQKISYINLPNCSYVGLGAFDGCSILRTIRLPKVTYFDRFVFDYRTPIENLYMNQITSVPSGGDPFAKNSSYLKSIIIPRSLIDDFIKHSIWGKFSKYLVSV